MKYMLMMHAPRAGWTNAGIGTWPPEDFKAHIRFMMDFDKELKKTGELVGAEGLAGPEAGEGRARRQEAARPRSPTARSRRRRSFSRATGSWTCENTERAYEIAARASAAPGKGGVPLNMPIEVRQVMSAPPVDM